MRDPELRDILAAKSAYGSLSFLFLWSTFRKDQSRDEDYVALAMSCNCMTLRSCSFSRYSRPFLTLT